MDDTPYETTKRWIADHSINGCRITVMSADTWDDCVVICAEGCRSTLAYTVDQELCVWLELADE